MYKSILHFLEKDIPELEKITENFYEKPQNIEDLVLAVKDGVIKLGIYMIEEQLNNINAAIKQSANRKLEWNVVRTDETKLITSLGTVSYQKTLFKNRKTNKCKYLLDELMELIPHERITADAVAEIYEEAVDSSYRKGGEKASLTEILTKQTVKNKLHEIQFPQEVDNTKPRVTRNIYIDADEDHISLQGEKGYDSEDKATEKKKCISKLVYVYEGKENIGKNSVRNKLINPHYISGVYEGHKRNKALWNEVDDYILRTYDNEEIEHIFVNGDGGGWIGTAKNVLGSKVIMVLDSFHLQKYIEKATNHMMDSVEDSRDALRLAIRKHQKSEVKRIFGILKEFAELETTLSRVVKSEQYILNHWDMIMNGLKYENELVGCSAEGHVSHVLADRMSSRPLGWSKHGADQMSRLRVYKMNGGNMLELAKYQHQIKLRKPIEKKYCSVQELLASEKKAKREVEKYADLINKTIAPGTAKKMASIKLSVMGL